MTRERLEVIALHYDLILTYPVTASASPFLIQSPNSHPTPYTQHPPHTLHTILHLNVPQLRHTLYAPLLTCMCVPVASTHTHTHTHTFLTHSLRTSPEPSLHSTPNFIILFSILSVLLHFPFPSPAFPSPIPIFLFFPFPSSPRFPLPSSQHTSIALMPLSYFPASPSLPWKKECLSTFFLSFFPTKSGNWKYCFPFTI